MGTASGPLWARLDLSNRDDSVVHSNAQRISKLCPVWLFCYVRGAGLSVLVNAMHLIGAVPLGSVNPPDWCTPPGVGRCTTPAAVCRHSTPAASPHTAAASLAFAAPPHPLLLFTCACIPGQLSLIHNSRRASKLTEAVFVSCTTPNAPAQHPRGQNLLRCCAVHQAIFQMPSSSAPCSCSQPASTGQCFAPPPPPPSPLPPSPSSVTLRIRRHQLWPATHP